MTLPRIDRRTFGLGAAGAWLAGCDEPEEAPSVRTPTTQRVAVVGGGVAGLHCALWLNQAKVEVQVYEALPRLGGRVLTARSAFQPLQTCELGAEFVGAYDAAMHTLAAQLSLKLGAVAIPDGFTPRHYLLEGSQVSEQEVFQGLSSLLAKVEAAMATQAGRTTLDNTTLADWLSTNTGSDVNLLRGLTAAYRTDFGLEPSELSAMHLSALFGRTSDGPRHFFPLRDASLRCEASSSSDTGGMDQFCTKIWLQSLTDHVNFECRLRRIARRADGFTLTFEQSNGLGFETEAEHVVLAIPFSALRDVDISGLNLDRGKRQLIAELGYGTGVKLAATFTGKPWRSEKSTGDVLDDNRRIWETGNNNTIGLLAALLGGDAGTAAMSGSADDQFAPILSELELLFQNIDFDDAYIAGSAVRVAWPSLPFARGSASCLRPGQWSRQREIARRDGALHFCGDHCSIDFQGRLEGAAESGALAAAEVLEDLKRPLPERHAKLVALKRKVWQPYSGSSEAPELSPRDRAETVVLQHAEYIAQLDD